MNNELEHINLEVMEVIARTALETVHGVMLAIGNSAILESLTATANRLPEIPSLLDEFRQKQEFESAALLESRPDIVVICYGGDIG